MRRVRRIDAARIALLAFFFTAIGYLGHLWGASQGISILVTVAGWIVGSCVVLITGRRATR